MDLQGLMAQIAGRTHSQTDLFEVKGNPEDQYRALLEWEFLKKGKILLKRYADLHERVGQLRLEQDIVRSQLLDLETATRHTLDLSTGDHMTIDFSSQPSVQAFFREVRQALGKNTSEETMNSPKNGSIYDRNFLAEESDDLLHYL